MGGEVSGVEERPEWFDQHAFGMMPIPQGNFKMGPTDEDVPWAMNAQSKSVTISSFWMDETEITNNEYRQFVFWVRDSIAYRILGEQIDYYLIRQTDDGIEIDPPLINWDIEINYGGQEERELLEDMYYPESERFFNERDLDPRKLIYHYFWIDYKQAAQKFTFGNQIRRRFNYETGQYNGELYNEEGIKEAVVDRGSFIMEGRTPIYPDTLCWVSDFSYSYNEPMAKSYFQHPAYDDYPVIGITWTQAKAFCIWRTQYKNNYLKQQGQPHVQNYELPTEAQWEYAARANLDLVPFPWGGYYTRAENGCFLCNFKPNRGNYSVDGFVYTSKVMEFEANDFGLYDMAGNVAEWTRNAYDESAYTYTHDMNPNYEFNALPEDPPALKRKVVRGGSWKDIGFYLQNGTRAFEYQDSAKSYIGFRCVRSYMGKQEVEVKANIY